MSVHMFFYTSIFTSRILIGLSVMHGVDTELSVAVVRFNLQCVPKMYTHFGC
jgi:hypothetical protein